VAIGGFTFKKFEGVYVTPWQATRHLFALVAVVGCGTGLRADSDDDLQATVDALGERVDELETIHQGAADLTPGGAYDYVSTEVGQLTLSLDRVIVSESGTRASLTLGNTTAAELHDVEGKVSWGATETTLSTRRRMLLAKRLAPGAWTRITIVLDTLATGGVGAMRISEVSLGAIALK
jgi:hypothetical protein